MDSAKILVVDDDTSHLEIIKRWLETEGHDVYTSTNGSDALDVMVEQRPVLTVTDLRMRPMDGFQLIQRLRESSDSLVLALTGLSGDEDKIRGLELGADEYLTTPISRKLFLAQVHSLLRRANLTEETVKSYSDACLMLDVITCETQLHGRDLRLRPTEFRLLAYLCLHNERVVRHEELLDRVWGEESGSLSSLKWYISAIKAKVEAMSKDHNIILTVRNTGYRYLHSELCPRVLPAESQPLIAS